MSSGKVRRDRSDSHERRSHRDGEKRKEASSGRQDRRSDVPELNEEEYDEEWEHEWEDIDEIGRGSSKYQKPYGRGQNPRFRGRGQTRWQHHFNKWDHKNSRGGSEHGSDGNRRSGRRSAADVEEDENLDMPPGVEMTNLKVKIQDGKRFAEPEEMEEFERSNDGRPYQRFPRSRGGRGYHHSAAYGNKEKWTQGNRYKRPAANEVLDCREFLNRRKRHYPDTSESDLREKLLRKDSDLGDLREIIESRDAGVMDLRDIIEPPDMSVMDEFSEDVVGEIDETDINLRIRDDLYERSDEDIDRHETDFDDHAHSIREGNDFDNRYGYLEDRHVIGDAVENEDEQLRDGDWQQDRWQRSRSRERRFDQVGEWRGHGKAAPFPEEDWMTSRGRRGSIGDRASPPRRLGDDHPPGRDRELSRNRSRDRVRSRERLSRSREGLSRSRSRERIGRSRERVNRSKERGNRSRERIRSPHSRNMSERSFEREGRPRRPSWERERNFSGPRGNIPPRDRDGNQRIERRASFEGEMRMDERHISPGRGRAFSPPRGGVRRPENDGLVPMSEVRRPAREILRGPPAEPGRSISRERSRDRIRSISQDRNRIVGRDRIGVGIEERNQEMRGFTGDRFRVVRPDGNLIMGRERQWSTEREGHRSIDEERNKMLQREKNRGFDQERDRSLDQQRNTSLDRERIRRFDRDGTRNFEGERNRSFDRERRSADRETNRNAGWDQRSVSRDRTARLETSIVRGRERSPPWVGPRTPSVERHRGPSWERPRSPHSTRDRSPARERPRSRSRSRGRDPNIPTGNFRDHSRGKEIQGRGRDKEKGISRPKNQEIREKTEEQPRRRDFNQRKDQDATASKARGMGPEPHRNLPKESNSTLKNRKREHEDNTSRERGRERHRSPEHHNLQEKTSKKTPLAMKEEYKQRFVREEDKPDKYNQREKFPIKPVKFTIGQEKKASGNTEHESREWEKIRDYQERRNVPSAGLPFIGEARRHMENSSREQQLRNHGSRNHSSTFLNDNRRQTNSAEEQKKKEEVLNWLNQGLQQAFSRPDEERRRPSRWGSPNRRDKPSEHSDSRKSAPHPSQTMANPHHSASNGKADDGLRQRRDLSSIADSQWNKPRSDLPINPSRDVGAIRPHVKSLQSPREVIFVRGLARDISESDIRQDISNCGLWAKDVRIVQDSDSGLSRGLAFITFNSVDEATRWMDLRKGVLNLRQNNHAPMDYSNPISKDWECVRCHSVNFKHRTACYQCNRSKEDCLDGWEETCPYPTNALLLRGLNPSTTTADVYKALKPRLSGQSRLDGVKMAQDIKGRPRSVCFVQLPSVVDSMALHKSLISEPLNIDNNHVLVAYCQLDKLPPMENLGNPMHQSLPVIPSAIPPAIPLSLPSILPGNNIPVVSRSSSTPVAAVKPIGLAVSTATIRSMLEGNYTEKDIPILAQYCASAYAKNPQEQSAYVKYYTKHYKEKLKEIKSSGK